MPAAPHDPLRALLYEEFDGPLFGNQKYVGLLASGFARRGSRVRLTLVVPTRRELYAARAGAEGETTICLDCPAVWRRPLLLRRLIRERRPHVLLAMNERSCLVLGAAALGRRLPILWYVKNYRRWDVVDAACFSLASRVLAIAPQVVEVKAAWLRRAFRGKVHPQDIAIPGMERLAAIPPCAGGAEGPLQILMLGALSHAKGTDTLVEAAQILDRRRIRARLRIAGEASPGSEALVERLRRTCGGLAHVRVEWLGWRSDVPELLARSDVVVLPSRSEGVPQSLIEAMAAGRPVIATSVGGIPSLVREGITGFLIPVGDARALAERLHRLAADRDLARRLASHARREARDRFDAERHLREMAGHLEQIARA